VSIEPRKIRRIQEKMPIYEYQCDQCGKIQEAIQKFSDRPLTQCRHCPGKLNKLISHSTFHLKGKGWYVTDYAGKTQKGKSDSAAAKKPVKGEATSTTASAKKNSD
jgi:putative FmdB family regulatory protein